MLETLYVIKSLANRLVLKQHLFIFYQAMLLLCYLPFSYKSGRETLIYGRETFVRGCEGSFVE
ncbi:hypothetical protein Goari_026793 [Gossypium aridum]|uniref:Uncharacterized protein n=1 Tax=Gossypium aridum TaxID=34290 RepID=A0A7J8YTE7_GOSAI|nr:hypothetical protein [Gossypium aridum]